jgi:hypothetical protein
VLSWQFVGLFLPFAVVITNMVTFTKENDLSLVTALEQEDGLSKAVFETKLVLSHHHGAMVEYNDLLEYMSEQGACFSCELLICVSLHHCLIIVDLCVSLHHCLIIVGLSLTTSQTPRGSSFSSQLHGVGWQSCP